MKNLLYCLTFLSLTCTFALAQKPDVYMCTAHPEYCRTVIRVLTPEEKAQLQKAEDQVDAATKLMDQVANAESALIHRLVKEHGLGDYPAAVWSHSISDFWGGTCIGEIKAEDGGFLVYTPSRDIDACIDKKWRKP